MSTCASRRIFDRKPVKPFGLLIFILFAVIVTHLCAAYIGAWVQEVSEPKVVYVPVKTQHPLTAWTCTPSEKSEYLRACVLRRQSMMTKP